MKIFIFTLSLLITTTIFGQVDFSGSWKLNSEKSQFNGVPGSPAADKMIVEQKGETITYQRTYQTNNLPKESLKIESTTTDSTKPIEISNADSKTEVSMKLAADNSGLIETRIYSYPETQTGEVAAKKTRTWSLSEDKQTLTIQDHIESTAGKMYDMVLIYDRQ